MDNQNLNQSMPTSANQFPTFDDMRKNAQKPPHFIVAIVITLVVGLGMIWYFFQTDQDFVPAEVTNKQEAVPTQEPNLESDINNIDVGDIDAEFESIDKDLNSL